MKIKQKKIEKQISDICLEVEVYHLISGHY